MTPLNTPAAVVPAVTASVAGPAMTPAAAPSFGLVLFIDLLFNLLLLLRGLRCLAGPPCPSGPRAA